MSDPEIIEDMFGQDAYQALFEGMPSQETDQDLFEGTSDQEFVEYMPGQDPVEELLRQLLDEHTADNPTRRYLSDGRVYSWITTLVEEGEIMDTPQNHRNALQKMEEIIISSGYRPVRRGYFLKTHQNI